MCTKCRPLVLLAIYWLNSLAGCISTPRTPQDSKPSEAFRVLEGFNVQVPELQKGQRWGCLFISPSFHAEKAIALTERQGGYEIIVGEFEHRYDPETKSRGNLSRWSFRCSAKEAEKLRDVLKNAFLPITNDYNSPTLDGIIYTWLACEAGGKVKSHSIANPHVVVPSNWSSNRLILYGFQIDGQTASSLQERLVRKRCQTVIGAWYELYQFAKGGTGRAEIMDPSKWAEYMKLSGSSISMREHSPKSDLK